MIDNDAIAALTRAEAISAARHAVAAAFADDDALVALPQEFTERDLERYMPHRRRARGTMRTTSIDDFAAYVLAHAEPGAAVFVASDSMSAAAVLNLGGPGEPGHADNRAVFAPRQTAAYAALIDITLQPRTQPQTAEFMEDWAPMLECLGPDAQPIEPRRAIDAVRRLTIDESRRVDSEVQALSAARSTFDTIKASAGAGHLPAQLRCTCVPYMGLPERVFLLRVSILTDGKAPTLRLRVVKAEEHQEQMAAELLAQLQQLLDGEVPVYAGAYAAAG